MADIINQKNIKPKYKKQVIHLDNTEYSATGNYNPKKSIVREFNPVSEKYEYKEVLTNLKLEWENTIEMAELNNPLLVKRKVK